MTEDSPFKSPEIVDELQDSFDRRSKEIFRLAAGLRKLEVLCAIYFAGLYVPVVLLMTMLDGAQQQGQGADSISSMTVFTTLGLGWTISAIINGLVVFYVLLKYDVLKRHRWTVAIAAIPVISIVGIVYAAGAFHRPLRAHGLTFGWIGPSQKEILNQLRHHDGSPVDPKTLGVKR
ncbi:hypothetical protein [Bremerella sp.]|uniref:hypothetical protein n=1 Tax=Bremerella sp. TaxID=2795602 RepID=UPI003919DF89